MNTPSRLNKDDANVTPKTGDDNERAPSILDEAAEATKRAADYPLEKSPPPATRSGSYQDIDERDAIKQQKGFMSFNPDMIPDNEPIEEGDDKLIGSIFVGKYEITELLGRGGMGAVYRARHMLTQRDVAIKLMHAHLVTDNHIFRRFKQEATAAARIHHPNAIVIHDMGMSDDERPFLIMDYIAGMPLSSLIKREGRLSGDVCLHIFSQACGALAEAHDQGIIHRDVKPSNIMILRHEGDQYFVKVVDFGIAKVFPQEGDPTFGDTTTGELFGSPPYMSPEQCLGKKLDARSDIYSMGCLMYEALTGAPPLVGVNALGTMYRHLNEMPNPLPSIDSDVRLTQRLDEILLKSMQKNPDNRYQMMSHLKKDIDSAIELANKKFAPLAQLKLRCSAIYRTIQNRLGTSKKLVVGLLLSLGLMAAVIIYGVVPLITTHDPEDRHVPWNRVTSEIARDESKFKKTETLLNAARNNSALPPYSIEMLSQDRAIGDFYRAAGKWDQALHNYNEAAQIVGHLNPGPAEAVQVSAIYAGAAECFLQEGKAKEAFNSAYRAQRVLIDAQRFGTVESLKAAALLGEACDALGDFPAAKQNFSAVIEYLLNDPKVARRADEFVLTVSSVADFMLKHDSIRTAETLYEKAESLWLALGERGLFNVAVAKNQLGMAYMQDHEYEKAAVQFQKAADIFTTTGGKDDRSRALALYNLADAQWRDGQIFEALQTHGEAKRIWSLNQNQSRADSKK